MGDLTGDLLAAVVAAVPERKQAALKVLRGEIPAPAARPATGPLLMSISAGAKFLGASRTTLYRLVEMGTIGKVELLPGTYRVRREDLEALASGKFGITLCEQGRPRKEGCKESIQEPEGRSQ
jgi:excisionase family DNA binding protein